MTFTELLWKDRVNRDREGRRSGENVYLRNLKGGITEQQKIDRKRRNNGEIGFVTV